MIKSVIYEIINLFNLKNNIKPYLYIGSQQKYTESYLGSSKHLKKDILIIGKKFFIKKILFEFVSITNVELRLIESNIQKELKCAESDIYYNRTNFSLKGYIETEEEKLIRKQKLIENRKKWFEKLTDEEKEEVNIKLSLNIINFNKSNKGKTYKEIYGAEKGAEKLNKCLGGNNGMSKKVIEIETKKIFNSITEIKKYLGIKKHRTIVKMCEKGEKIKFI